MAKPTPRPDPLAATSLGEAAAIGRIEKALFGTSDRLVNVGRYEIKQPIGAGAFGKVYRARDPELERDVALKVLAISDDEADRAELLREARVMATLAHPNIASVHDAGVIAADTHGPARVFIAMELVEGRDLRRWLETPRTTQAIVDVLRQAGRGLAAAHGAGVIHRDFKPDNVLVGDDGRVRVVDFGLARSRATGEVANAGTATALAGTPAYMAPEQLAGARASARSDQFAFCVTAWEALHGGRPFAGTTIDELRAAMDRPPMARRRVAGKLSRALSRGLAVDPDKRWPAMQPLVDALAPRRSRWLVPVVVAAAAIAVTLGITSRSQTPTDPCPPSAELAGIWDPPRRIAIESAFAATRAPFQADTFARVAAALDRDSVAWVFAQRAACRATAVEHAQSPAALDRRMRCLHEWRRRLGALVDGFATATPTVVQGAVQSVADLPPLARCADVDALAMYPEGVDRTRLEALADQLATARTKLVAAKADDALAIIDRVAADPLARGPLAVPVALARAETLTTLGRLDDAQTAAQAAFDGAVSSGDRAASGDAALLIAKLGVYDTRRKQDALRWVTTGTSIADRLEHAGELHAKLALVEGNIHMINSDAPAAAPALERAVAGFRALGHPQLGNALAMLGVSELGRGEVAAADRELRAALASNEAALGAKHPDVASVLSKLALVEAARGRYGDAMQTGARAIALLVAVNGPRHPLLVYAHGSHGQHAQMHGELEAAAADFTEALSIAETAMGATHPLVAQLSLVLADVRIGQHRTADAISLAQRGREIVARTADARDLGLAYADAVLGRAIAQGGHRRDALPRMRDAVKRCDAFPAGLPSGPCAIVYEYLGLVSDDPREAERVLAAAERAITTGTPDPLRLAQVRVALAKLRAAHDRKAAAALGALALREFPEQGDPQIRTELERTVASLR